VIHIQTDRYESVPAYESWWEVPVAEVAQNPEVQKARAEHEREAARRRWHL
jgi:3D-(3,5/4)-trihydroxycyclohexane-1,2-dione acylhydrolase (decyclizing)